MKHSLRTSRTLLVFSSRLVYLLGATSFLTEHTTPRSPQRLLLCLCSVAVTQLLLLQYASFSTSDRRKKPGSRSTVNGFITRGAGSRPQSSSAASSPSPFPSSPLVVGLLIPTPGGARSIDGAAIGNRGKSNSSHGGESSTESASVTSSAFSSGFAGIVGGGGGGGGEAAVVGRVSERREGPSVGEKVVARALRCLGGMCRSKQCHRFMTPLAREVRCEVLLAEFHRVRSTFGLCGRWIWNRPSEL